MPFSGIADPAQLKILNEVLEEHCAAARIRPGTPEHTKAALAVYSFFVSGVTTLEGLSDALTVVRFGVHPPPQTKKPAAP